MSASQMQAAVAASMTAVSVVVAKANSKLGPVLTQRLGTECDLHSCESPSVRAEAVKYLQAEARCRLKLECSRAAVRTAEESMAGAGQAENMEQLWPEANKSGKHLKAADQSISGGKRSAVLAVAKQ